MIATPDLVESLVKNQERRSPPYSIDGSRPSSLAATDALARVKWGASQ